MSRIRRSFQVDFLQSEPFAALSLEVRWLYICLNLNADDDGFVRSPGRVTQSAGLTQKELQSLVEAGLILLFDSGPVLIAHWLLHNRVRPDRYRETDLKAEKAQIELGKDRIYRRKEENGKPVSTRFLKPTLEEVRSFIHEKNFRVDADAWYAHYESNGWMVGKNKMKDWRASINYWEHNKTVKKGSEKTTGECNKNAFFPYQPQWY